MATTVVVFIGYYSQDDWGGAHDDGGAGRHDTPPCLFTFIWISCLTTTWHSSLSLHFLPPWGLPRSSAKILLAKVCLLACLSEFSGFLPNGICTGFKRRCHSCFFGGGSDEGPPKTTFKALGRGGVIIRPLFLAWRASSDPTFQSIEENVFCKISATTIPNLDFNGAFEPPDP